MNDRSKRDESASHPEPEIIPPDQAARSFRGENRPIWFVRGQGHREIHIVRPGFFSIFLALLFVGVVAAMVLAMLVSILLVWIPIVALALAGLIGAGLVRQWWRSRDVTQYR